MRRGGGHIPPRIAKVILLWGLVVASSSLLTWMHWRAYGFGSAIFYWPALTALRLLAGHSWPKLLVVSVWLPYNALLHLGLLLAMWRWRSRWLLLEAGTISAVVCAGLAMMP